MVQFQSDLPSAPDLCPDCNNELQSRGNIRHYCPHCGERKKPDDDPSDESTGLLDFDTDDE